MQKILINQHKRQDVFKCANKAHFKFDKNVSVYHVMREKNCFPQGCIYFVWRCQLLNKGRSCPKGYEHVGRKCFGCKYYYEDKICHQPDVILDNEKFKEFEESLEEYEEWLESVVGKDVEFSGEINSVKPHLKKIVSGSKQNIFFKGFLLSFKQGFIDRVFLDDYLYASVSIKSHEKNKFAAADKVDFLARLRVDHGRIVLDRVRRVEFNEKSDASSWDLSQAIVAKNVGTELDCQPEKCLRCEKGCLLDVVDRTEPKEKIYRHLFCLAGIEDPEVCYYDLKKKIERNKLQEDVSEEQVESEAKIDSNPDK
jgi:hypothetical protein